MVLNILCFLPSTILVAGAVALGYHAVARVSHSDGILFENDPHLSAMKKTIWWTAVIELVSLGIVHFFLSVRSFRC